MNHLFSWGALFSLISYFGPSQRPSTKPASDAPTVCWQENRKLTWDDFQAKVQPKNSEVDTTFGVAVGATTEANAVLYELRTDAGKLVKVFVRVEFDTQKSWVNKVRSFDHLDVLRHEQLHFDIVELTGRKIRRLLARSAAQHIYHPAPAITKQLDEIYDAEDRLNGRYDAEAGFGNSKAQVRWQVAIKKQLAALALYKSTPADCELPQ